MVEKDQQGRQKGRHPADDEMDAAEGLDLEVGPDDEFIDVDGDDFDADADRDAEAEIEDEDFDDEGYVFSEDDIDHDVDFGDEVDEVLSEVPMGPPVRVPVIALVGRPNVGKSRMFNRMVGKRDAIVEDTPGVTRDRNYGRSDWYDRVYDVIDTGGFEPETEDKLLEQMREQAQLAIEEADVIVFVTDGKVGLLPSDQIIAGMLRTIGKPVYVAVNKIDVPWKAAEAVEFYALGLEHVIAVSAEHGVGFEELMETVTAGFPTVDMLNRVQKDDAIKVAVVGKPNAGKSTLINRILGQERLLTSEIPGTTRDSIDSVFIREDGRRFVFIDTAGMRRKRSITRRLEKYSVIKAVQAVERADVVLVMMDAIEGATDQDAKIIYLAIDRGAALALLFNKWDLVPNKEGNTVSMYENALYEKLPFCNFAPVMTLSAKTGQRAHRILDLIYELYETAHRRVATGELNRVFEDLIARNSPPSVRNRPLRFYYINQVSVGPPTFLAYVNRPRDVPKTYRRYILNQLREAYGFVGAPIRLILRQPKGRHRWSDRPKK